MHTIDSSLGLRVGEWVEVRSAEEILATLSDGHSVAGLPFMPEMLRYCGKRFRVYKSAHKTADTIELFTIRRMENAVHLEGLRCDGSSHGGCQAGCLLFWKECWLKRVPDGELIAKSNDRLPEPPAQKHTSAVALDSLLRATTRPVTDGEPQRYQCQATEMLIATTAVRWRERVDPRFYVKDITSGNVKLFDFIRFGALAMLNAFLRRSFQIAQHLGFRGDGLSYPRVRGRAGDKTPTAQLNLKVGELVRVRSKTEIEGTLNRHLRNRGLWFDVEMLPYCGKGNFRVLRRVDKILNEKTGHMMKFQNPCIILDGVTCSGNYLARRMFSPKHEYIYWREIWLERVETGDKEVSQS